MEGLDNVTVVKAAEFEKKNNLITDGFSSLENLGNFMNKGRDINQNQII
jgi:hypothetical protein